MDIRTLKTDREGEEEGLWRDVQIFPDAVARMKIARYGNRRHRQVREQLERPHRRAIRAGKLAQEVRDRIDIEATARGLLRDWEGLTNGDAPFEHSDENAIAFLTEYSDVRIAVEAASLDAEAYRVDFQEESVGN